MNIKLKFYGGVGQVTGSNFLLEADGQKILIDCGLYQESRESEGKNRKPFPYDPKSIDYLFVTHGHLDHIGRIPKLVKDGFDGKIFSTPETKEISRLILEDALKVQRYNQDKHKEPPLYSELDVKKTFSLWQTRAYGEICQVAESVQAIFRNSGHILGSAMVEFKFRGHSGSLLFTGDLGSFPNPLLQPAETLADVRYLIIESVYGDRRHSSYEDGCRVFKEAVLKTIKNKGNLLIPSFSLERAQVILYELNNLVEKKEIPPIPIFLDSPLAIKLLQIYEKSPHLFNGEVKKLIEAGDDVFSFRNLELSEEAFESKLIKGTPPPKIIIAGSGMSQGGRIIFHEAKYLPDPNNTLLLVGYQAAGTLGKQLSEGVRDVEIKGQKVKVRAKVEHIDSFSGHKDLDGLLEFVNDLGASLERVFVVMGEPKAALFLAQRIKDYLDIPAVVPKIAEEYEISF